jgi:hypothetical protein
MPRGLVNASARGRRVRRQTRSRARNPPAATPIQHPTAGLLRLEHTYLWLGQRLDTRIVTYTPADEQTRERLEALHRSLPAAA